MKYSQAAVLPVALLGACSNVVAQSSASSISQSTSVVTSTPTPTGVPDSPLASQAPLPPKQAWCPSEIFCAGEILQSINIAKPYSDSKTIVDKPTTGTSNATIAAFRNYTSGSLTYGEVTQFLDNYFQGEGLELKAVSVDNFPQNPSSISAIPNQYVRQFLLAVHQVWDLLIRDTDQTTLCTGGKCESSLIPLNHTFVVPGGRFREQCEFHLLLALCHAYHLR
jgi:alpha,alpha-trehalase